MKKLLEILGTLAAIIGVGIGFAAIALVATQEGKTLSAPFTSSTYILPILIIATLIMVYRELLMTDASKSSYLNRLLLFCVGFGWANLLLYYFKGSFNLYDMIYIWLVIDLFVYFGMELYKRKKLSKHDMFELVAALFVFIVFLTRRGI